VTIRRHRPLNLQGPLFGAALLLSAEIGRHMEGETAQGKANDWFRSLPQGRMSVLAQKGGRGTDSATRMNPGFRPSFLQDSGKFKIHSYGAEPDLMVWESVWQSSVKAPVNDLDDLFRQP
jgi:hypothetical protein